MFRHSLSLIRCGLLVALACPSSMIAAADAQPDRAVEEDGVGNRAVQLAMLESMQQPLTAAEPSTTSPIRTSRYSSRSLSSRLARGPNMFGDSQLVASSLKSNGVSNGQGLMASFGSNSAGSRKIAENDKVLPMDRVFFNYNYFSNSQPTLAPESLPGVPTPVPALRSDVNRYTLGFEKTFLDGEWSFEARLAMASSVEATALGAQYDGGVASNVTLFLKKLFYTDDSIAFGGGLGIGLPNASDVIVTTPPDTFRYSEQTTHLMPYVGFLAMPTDDWFISGFVQVDFATGSDHLDSVASGRPAQRLAAIPEQNLMFLDLSVGRWLFVDDDARHVTGLAAVVELHYLTTLNDTATSTVPAPMGPPGFPVGFGTYTLSNVANRVDVLNLTAGVHFQLGRLSNLRVAGVAPLRSGFDRLFDSEVQVSFNRFF